MIRHTLRHSLRITSRIAESILGSPADLISMPEKILGFLFKKKSSKLPVNIKKIRKTLIPIPTSLELREFTKKKFKSYLEPRNKTEEITDKIVSMTASIAGPTLGLGAIKTALKGATIIVGVEESTKYLGFSTKTQKTVGLLGSFVATGKIPTPNQLITATTKKVANSLPHVD